MLIYDLSSRDIQVVLGDIGETNAASKAQHARFRFKMVAHFKDGG